MRWRTGAELQILAPIVASGKARFACLAYNVRFDRDAISDCECRDRRVDLDDKACRLMPQDMRLVDHPRTDPAMFPEVHVRT